MTRAMIAATVSMLLALPVVHTLETACDAEYTAIPARVGEVRLHSDDDLYNSLLHFDNATQQFYKDPDTKIKGEACLNNTKQILIKHGMQDVLAIDLKHRHNSMHPSHRLVETIDVEGRKSTMRPEVVGDATPFAFVMRGDSFVPYEYVKDSAVARNSLNMILSTPAFTLELAEVIKAHGMSDLLGFHIVHRHHLDGETKGHLETPGDAEDELLIRPYNASVTTQLGDSESVQVGWSWSNDKDDEVFCGHHCGSHSICTSHCNSHAK